MVVVFLWLTATKVSLERTESRRCRFAPGESSHRELYSWIPLSCTEYYSYIFKILFSFPTFYNKFFSIIQRTVLLFKDPSFHCLRYKFIIFTSSEEPRKPGAFTDSPILDYLQVVYIKIGQSTINIALYSYLY